MSELSTPHLPEELLNAIKQAREIKQLDTNYSNGSGPYSPTLDHLPQMLTGIEDDQNVKDLIQHLRITGLLPPD